MRRTRARSSRTRLASGATTSPGEDGASGAAAHRLGALARTAARLCGATDALIYTVDRDMSALTAKHGRATARLQIGDGRPVQPDTVPGRAIIERRIIHARCGDATDVIIQPADRRRHGRNGTGTVVAVPLLLDHRLLGVLVARRRGPRPFSREQIARLESCAGQAALALDYAALARQVEVCNRDLEEALERQTATSEILRVISGSASDVQPVFEMIVQSAVRLCDAQCGAAARFDGELMHIAARHNYTPEVLELSLEMYPRRPNREQMLGRAILTRAVVHVEDVQADPEYLQPVAQAGGWRAMLAVPMLREGSAVGAIFVTRGEPGPFSATQIRLLQTFADQAVIAIENVRLFRELEERSHELTRSVEELRALGEVGQAVSSTLDLETVLRTIASRANQLARTDACTLHEYDEVAQVFHERATHHARAELAAIAQAQPIRTGEGVLGRLPLTRAPVQIVDLAKSGADTGHLREPLLRTGVRALLAIPLLREEHLIGALIVFRHAPGAFAPEVIKLLQTFATQSAIAIHNARLFREIEAKSEQLEIASRHKSQFLANMSHELRTPLNAILGYTELIVDGIYGAVPDRMAEVLERVDKNGRQLLGLINDILDLSKIEAGQLTLIPVDYSVEDIVRSAVATAEPLAVAKQIALVVTVAPHLPTGLGDARRLTQVLLNLIGNAVKFTDAGRVTVDARQAGDCFLVAVRDTGPGIADEERERIFEEFQQAEATRGVKGGTGLGLAIARRIIEMHGGRLALESAVGLGSTFTLTVPMRVAEPAITASG